MELKVRSLDVIEPKSVQEVEQQLTENHEKEVSGIPHIDFSNNSNKEVTPEIEQKIEEVTPEIEQVEEELSEEKVLSYIGKRYNKQINSFDELVAEMVREDLKGAERDELIKNHGYQFFRPQE